MPVASQQVGALSKGGCINYASDAVGPVTITLFFRATRQARQLVKRWHRNEQHTFTLWNEGEHLACMPAPRGANGFWDGYLEFRRELAVSFAITINLSIADP